jgi:integrase
MVNAVELIPLPKDFYWREWIKKRNKCILAILYHMGLRPKEVCGLSYSDFIPKKMAFHIRGSNNHSNQDRLMPIPEKLFPFLEDWLRLGKRSQWLFPSHNDITSHLSSARWKSIMRAILQGSGLYIHPIGKEMPRTGFVYKVTPV